MDKKTGVKRLRIIAGGPTGVDKTSFVRYMQIPGDFSLSKESLAIIAKCAQHVRRVSIEARGSKQLSVLWELLKHATALEYMQLYLVGSVFRAFDETTEFPASVKVLDLLMDCNPSLKASLSKVTSSLFRMLDSRAPNVSEIHLNGGYGGHIRVNVLRHFFDLDSYSTFTSKI